MLPHPWCGLHIGGVSLRHLVQVAPVGGIPWGEACVSVVQQEGCEVLAQVTCSSSVAPHCFKATSMIHHAGPQTLQACGWQTTITKTTKMTMNPLEEYGQTTTTKTPRMTTIELKRRCPRREKQGHVPIPPHVYLHHLCIHHPYTSPILSHNTQTTWTPIHHINSVLLSG
jgi:hypothetical protein